MYQNLVRAIVLVGCILLALSSCGKSSYEPTTPALPVSLELNLQLSRYRALLEPSQMLSITDPPSVYSAMGYAGVLVVHSLQAEVYYAFDLSCPVENSPTVRIQTSGLEAICPKCGTHYNVLTGSGAVSSGVGASPLRRYRCYYDSRTKALHITN